MSEHKTIHVEFYVITITASLITSLPDFNMCTILILHTPFQQSQEDNTSLHEDDIDDIDEVDEDVQAEG